MLSVSYMSAQGKQTTKKTPTPTVRKVGDPRLIPPAIRKFNHSFELTSTYDKFKDITQVQLRIPINSVESMYYWFSFTGEKILTPPKAIIFQYFGNSKKFDLPVNETIVLTDRDRFHIKLIQLPELDNGKIPFAGSIDYSTFLLIANGVTIAMQIGQTELDFDEQSLEALKDFASRTDPKANRNAEIASNKAIEQEIKSEAQKLIKLTPREKAKIKEVIEGLQLFQQGIRKASESDPPDKDGMGLMLGFSVVLKRGLDAFPSGLLKQTVSSAIEDATLR